MRQHSCATSLVFTSNLVPLSLPLAIPLMPHVQSRANDQFKLATDPLLEGVSGRYYVSARDTRANAAAYDAAARKKLWDYCEAVSGVTY